MSTSVRVEFDWLAAWAVIGVSLREALDRFDNLPCADSAQLAGFWRGRSLPLGHPSTGSSRVSDGRAKRSCLTDV